MDPIVRNLRKQRKPTILFYLSMCKKKKERNLRKKMIHYIPMRLAKVMMSFGFRIGITDSLSNLIISFFFLSIAPSKTKQIQTQFFFKNQPCFWEF